MIPQRDAGVDKPAERRQTTLDEYNEAAVADFNIDYPYPYDEPTAESDYRYNTLTRMVPALRSRFVDRTLVYIAGNV